jgi:hypothetical protein
MPPRNNQEATPPPQPSVEDMIRALLQSQAAMQNGQAQLQTAMTNLANHQNQQGQQVQQPQNNGNGNGQKRLPSLKEFEKNLNFVNPAQTDYVLNISDKLRLFHSAFKTLSQNTVTSDAITFFVLLLDDASRRHQRQYDLKLEVAAHRAAHELTYFLTKDRTAQDVALNVESFEHWMKKHFSDLQRFRRNFERYSKLLKSNQEVDPSTLTTFVQEFMSNQQLSRC